METQKPEETGLAVTEANNMEAFIDEMFTNAKLGVWTTIDSEKTELTLEGKKLIIRAMGGSDIKAASLKEKAFLTQDLLIHMVSIVDDKTGEISEQKRTVLIGPDGRTAAICSNGAIAGLARIMQLFGKPTWKPALRLRLKEQETRHGFRTYNIEVE